MNAEFHECCIEATVAIVSCYENIKSKPIELTETYSKCITCITYQDMLSDDVMVAVFDEFLSMIDNSDIAKTKIDRLHNAIDALKDQINKLDVKDDE